MRIHEILRVIRDLSYSKGFYGRLLRDILDMKKYSPDDFSEWVDNMEAQNFSSSLDLVLYLEG